MDKYDLIRIQKNDYYEIAVNKKNNQLILWYFGVWDRSAPLDSYLIDIKNALDQLKRSFNLIIDLQQYRGSKTEYFHLHVEAQNLAIETGLSKTAVVLQNNPMLKITVEYIFKQSGLKAEYFNNFSTAESWLIL